MLAFGRLCKTFWLLQAPLKFDECCSFSFAIAIFTRRCPAPCSVQSSKTISPPLTFVRLQCASKRFTTPFPSASIFLPVFFCSPVLVSLCFLLCIFFIFYIYIIWYMYYIFFIFFYIHFLYSFHVFSLLFFSLFFFYPCFYP